MNAAVRIPLEMPFKTVRRLFAVCVIAASVTPSSSMAATDSDTFDVTATVIDACLITANDHDFGNYSPVAGADADASSTIDVTCTPSATYDVELNAGTTVGGAISARLMTDGSNTLEYNLYTDAGRSTIWGDGTGASITASGTGSGAQQSLTVYGRIPASQSVPAGSYSDTVTATINF